MAKRLLIGSALVIAIAVAIVSYMFFKPPQEASKPIAAIPLAANTAVPTTDVSSGAASGGSAPTTAPTAAADTGDTQAVPDTTSSASAGATVFEIVQDESQAQFTIDEVLEGSPKTVVGTTSQVAGQIAVDPANPTATQIGTIQINARTLETDSSMRNRAIKNRILMTDDNEFITFVPTEISGLPAAGAVGETYTFKVAGDLTIKGVTKTTTFDVTVTATSAQRLEGTASTTVRYADFDVAIPSVPMVAGVADEVKLELNFVAAPKA